MINSQIAQLLKTFWTGQKKVEQDSLDSATSTTATAFDRQGTKGYYNFLWESASGEKCLSGQGTIGPSRIPKFVQRHHPKGSGLPYLRKISISNAARGGAEWKVVTSSHIRRLRLAFPRLVDVSLEGFNFGAAHRKRRLKFRDFPQRLQSLTLRGSVLDVRTFFAAGPAENGELTALDLGRCFFLNDEKARGDHRRVTWPSLPALESLCLEGCPFLISGAVLGDVLMRCPSLQVLDLEGTSLQSSIDLALIGQHLPLLRELFIGWTDVNDSSLLALAHGSFQSLVTLCLVGTHVTNLGVLAVCAAFPKLRAVRVSMVRCAVRKLEQVDVCRAVSIQVACVRSENVRTVLRHEGCEHFVRFF